MAQRLGAAIGAGLGDLGDTLLERALREENRRAQTGEALLKDYTDKVMAGQLDPKQASDALASMGVKVPAGHFERLEPSVATRVQSIADRITKAGTQQEVPTESAIHTEAKAKRLPVRFGEKGTRAQNPGMQDLDISGNLPAVQSQPIAPDVDQLLQQREDKLNAFAPTELNEYDANTGANIKRFVPSRADKLVGTTIQTTPTPTQAGQNKLSEWQANEGSAERTTAEINIANRKEAGTRGEKVKTSAAEAGAGEEARQRVQFQPQFVKARVDEATQRTMAEAKARNDVEAQKQARDSANAAGQLLPFFDRIVALTDQLNITDVGPVARLSGLGSRAANVVGMSPTLNAIDIETSRYIRPLAVAMGMKEANVSDTEAQQIHQAIGVNPGATRGERFDSLERLRDMITIGPIVAGKLGPEATIQQRLSAIESLARQRKDTEQQARAAGVKLFKDPVTGVIMDVLQY